MKQLLLFIAIIGFCSKAHAVILTGVVKDKKGEPLPFSSLLVKGSTKGTSANNQGKYMITLPPGNYTIVCQRVGYKKIEKTITIGNADATLDFELEAQEYDLGSVVVKTGAEDPAYAIIREAIKKRPFYEKEINQYSCEVYLKGQMKLRNYPKRFFGQKVDFEDGDTSKRKMIFLSETIANYSFEAPDKKKVEVVSTKVSGNSNGFGFSFPQIFSFYENNIQLGSGLNPRGFVSPIANGALGFYKYKFEGTFFDNNKMVSRIKVTPKRTYEPLFNGYINIIENEWRIHSVQLTLYKENQMQLVDTLTIEQLYVPANNAWVLKQQIIYPSVKFLGFDGYGSFVQVYDKYNLDPKFEKKYFGNTILKFFDSSNKRSPAYWDAARPMPLQADEIADYRKKDSLEKARRDPKYLDSLDRVRNKFSPFGLIMGGQSFGKERKRYSISIAPLLDAINFNTVEGAVFNIAPTYTKRLDTLGRRRIIITPDFRYGMSTKRFNAYLAGTYIWGKKYFNSFTATGGRTVFQFNNANPVEPRVNTFATLAWEKNLMKLYEASFGRVNYTAGIGDGFTVSTTLFYQDRSPLENTTLHKWQDIKNRSFTPNTPQELGLPNIPRHQAFTASVQINWQPGSKYIEFPDRKVNIGASKYPRLSLAFTQGVNGLMGSDINYSKWRFGVSDNLNFKLGGRFNYRAAVGGFLNRRTVYIPDMQHYLGNQVSSATPFLQSFQLMPLYAYSNAEKFYGEMHVEHHFNGLLTNKIPVFKKLNWFLVTGSNLLYLKDRTYGEVFVGLENIFKILRLDYVQSFTNKGWQTSGIKFSLPMFTETEAGRSRPGL
jgi:hypothetical protein